MTAVRATAPTMKAAKPTVSRIVYIASTTTGARPNDAGFARYVLLGHDGDVGRWRRLIAAVATSVTVVTLGGVAVGALTPQEDDGRIPLTSLPQGVSLHDISGRSIFLVRQGDEVTGFLRLSSLAHTALVWCQADDVFMAPAWGETFDIHGRVIHGPVSRNMDRVRVTVVKSTAVVEATAVTRGARRDNAQTRDVVVEWYAHHPDQQFPNDYCSPSIP